MKKQWLQYLVLICISCAPLSKSQLKMSHNYFESLANYPGYYKELNVRVADLNLEAKNLESSLKDSDSLRIVTIIQSINEYEKAMKLPEEVLLHVRNIDSYVQQYYLFLPNGFNLYRVLKSTTETVGGVFGLGSVISGILPNSTNNLSVAKKRKIQAHVLQSEQSLIRSLEALKAYIDGSYLPRLDAIYTASIADFEALLASINHKTPPLDYYTRHNRMITAFYQRFFHTRNLVQQLSKSIDSFISVEKEIAKSFQIREKIDVERTHMNQLLSDMQRIDFLVKELNQKQNKEKYPSNDP